MSAPSFVHLRLHSEYSIVDGIVRIDEAVEAAVTDGMPALALTDLSNVFGLVKFYQELGFLRFNLTMGMFAMMMSLPIKMILRWTLNVKYIWVCGSYFNI